MASKAPLTLLKRIQNDYSNILSKEYLKFNLDEISSKTFEEQQSFAKNLLEKLHTSKNRYIIKTPEKSMKCTILHEYGHIIEKLINKNQYNESFQFTVEHTQTLDSLKKLVELKKLTKIPEFYERKEQEIVSEVSLYSQSGIGEFIAETFAGLMKGKKYSKEVMALYKKYGGPIVG